MGPDVIVSTIPLVVFFVFGSQKVSKLGIALELTKLMIRLKLEGCFG